MDILKFFSCARTGETGNFICFSRSFISRSVAEDFKQRLNSNQRYQDCNLVRQILPQQIFDYKPNVYFFSISRASLYIYDRTF